MRWIFLLCCAAAALAQGGTDPKAKPEDYEVHGRSKDVSIGAEFMVHSFSGQGQTYIARDFLVVEVALYPPKGQTLDLKDGSFALRINGKKQTLAPAAPQLVAATLQHPEWRSGPRLEGLGGLGNGGVILGRPLPPQVPGGPPNPAPLPSPADNPSGIDSEPRVTAVELVIQTALPEGPHRRTVSGFLYFPYKGKISSIKSLELLYEDAALQLR